MPHRLGILLVFMFTAPLLTQQPAPPSTQPTLHSLTTLTVPHPVITGTQITLWRSNAQPTDSLLTILGLPPNEPSGEMIKPHPPTTAPIETLKVLHNGDLLLGENAGLVRDPTGRSDPGHCSPIDF